MQEDEEDRQYANEFEDEIQDFVYVPNLEMNTEEMPTEALSRAKRQVDFPDQSKSTPTIIDRENLAKTSDFYNDMILKNETSFIITNLTHFRTYVISIRVCRKPEDDELPGTDTLAVLKQVINIRPLWNLQWITFLL